MDLRSKKHAPKNKLRNESIFVVHNPVAGTSDAEAVRAEIDKHLAGWRYQVYKTTGKEDVREVVEDALRQGYQTVWAAGGDGTVSAVANALVGKDLSLGIIPLGTGNVLAKELGIPIDVAAACDLLVGAHQTRMLDAMQVNDDYFLLSVSAGMGALMMAETAREQKRRIGNLAYLLNGVRVILSKAIWPFRVSVDGKPLVVRASTVIATNVGAIGYKEIRWGDQVRPDDGKIDLCRVRVDSVLRLVAVLNGLLFGRQNHLKELACDSASRFIEIQSHRQIPVQGDGENIGFTPVRIEVVPSCLSVVVPLEEE